MQWSRGITLRGNENGLVRKKFFSLLSSVVLIRISISYRAGWLFIMQLRIITLIKSYMLICNTTWQEREITTKHFYNLPLKGDSLKDYRKITREQLRKIK